MLNSVGRPWGRDGKPSRPTYTIRPTNTFPAVAVGRLNAEFPARPRVVTPARDADCTGAGQTHRSDLLARTVADLVLRASPPVSVSPEAESEMEVSVWKVY